MQFRKSKLFWILILILILSVYSKTYLEKGTNEIGGNVSFYSIDYNYGVTKQYVFEIEPIYNYYMLNNVYIGPILSYTGFFLGQNSFPGVTFYNEYILSIGGRIGISNRISNSINLFEGINLNYNFNRYWYSNISYPSHLDGFVFSPFFGIKLIEYEHIALPLTLSYRIEMNKGNTTGDFSFNIGLLLLLY